MRKSATIPTSDHAVRMAKIFHRKLTTHWSAKEVKSFRDIAPHIDEEEYRMLERYCAAERRKGEKGLHRRDMQTLLNNYTGEIDRARAYCEAHPIVQIRKIVPMPLLNDEPYVPPTDPKELEEIERFNEQRRARK